MLIGSITQTLNHLNEISDTQTILIYESLGEIMTRQFVKIRL